MGRIVRISGPLVEADSLPEARMYELVRVGDSGLFGEIIQMKSGVCSIQVYEDTEGLKPGEPVTCTGLPLSIMMGPGLIGSIYDGIGRPLPVLQKKYGDFIARGVSEESLDTEKKWDFTPIDNIPDVVNPGDVVGWVQESKVVKHYIMVPPGMSGKLTGLSAGSFTVTEPIAKVGDQELKLANRWAVRHTKPVSERLSPTIPMVTGQRILDMLFPISRGGTACVPGPFGSGKTVVQHQLAKWADADIIVYVGCGERGNEMTDVLNEFPELIDPKTGTPLMERTVLIANTSNMPVAAREASVFSGSAIAQYYRDMGYNVALMADSTSRWAEAMREISGRLEEMPGEEGFPAYLASRIASFYERAGYVKCLGKPERKGSLTMIGAVSPPGGDLSEPVVQATLRAVKVFWALDSQLAYKRHFPSINWLNSYSLYAEDVGPYLDENIGADWTEIRKKIMAILDEESHLEEIVRLVGQDALSPGQKLTIEYARSIREDFLQQNAFMSDDTYSTPEKQLNLLRCVTKLYEGAANIVADDDDFKKFMKLDIHAEISTAKTAAEPSGEFFTGLLEKVDKALDSIGGSR
ncbi:MAG: V-type ATP synthase subunit A [Caldisericia bacterium]